MKRSHFELQPAIRAEGPQTIAGSRTATTWLVAGLSMFQPLSTELDLSTLPGIAADFDASAVSVQWTLNAFIAALGVWSGVSYDGSVYPLTLTIAACAAVCRVVAFTLVRRDGDVSRHG